MCQDTHRHTHKLCLFYVLLGVSILYFTIGSCTVLLEQLEEERYQNINSQIYRAVIICQAIYRMLSWDVSFKLHSDFKRVCIVVI